MLQGKTRWYPPYVPFERKSVFCMTKAQAHEVYGLSDSGVDARTLGEADFTDDEWQKCFEEVPRRGSKVKCRVVRAEFWPRFYTLFTSVYQEPPSNYGMEVTKAFARGFLHENVKGPVNWALFAEDMIFAMDASKLQAKKNRWAVFHGSSAAQNSRSRQGPKIERTEVGHEQGLETPLLGLQDVKKNMCFSLESLIELDRMHEAVEARHAFALSEFSEARRKVDLHKAEMHREEGAQLLVDSLRRQLQDAEAEVQEAEKGPDAQDAGKLQVLRSRVDTLTLTIHTLAGVVVDIVPDGARSAALEQLELAQQREALVRAQLDFIKSMQAKRSKVLLCVPTPKLPPVDMGSSDTRSICSACGLVMYDEDGLGMFVLPCAHVYHIYCFAHLATSKETCMGMGCMQTISPVARSLAMLGHTGAPSYGVESRTTSAPVLINSATKTTIESGMHSISMLSLLPCYLPLGA